MKIDKVTARNIKGLRTEISTENMSFRVSVYGATVLEDNVLLVPQWDGYDIPGGGIEIGETTKDALIREVFEETGLQVEPIMDSPLCVTHDFFIHPTDNKKYHYILIYYACELVGGEISTENFQDDEKEYAKAAEWVSISSLAEMKFYNPVDNVDIILKARSKIRGS